MNWILLIIIFTALIAFDLAFFRYKNDIKNAVKWSIFWLGCGVLFGIYVLITQGVGAGSEYFSAFLVEKSLSVDNLFVMYLIFQYFKTPAHLQHKCLIYGIIGAAIMRAVIIITGVELVQRFDWLFYIFGAVLLFSSFKLLKDDDDEGELQETGIVKWFKRYFNVYDEYGAGAFYTGGHFTLMAVVVLMIESSDLIFAVDSIPAVLGISKSSFIVYSSNLFAILGLRSLYFVLASMLGEFKGLKYGIFAILLFISVKMLAHDLIHVNSMLTLTVIISCLVISILAAVKNRR